MAKRKDSLNTVMENKGQLGVGLKAHFPTVEIWIGRRKHQSPSLNFSGLSPLHIQVLGKDVSEQKKRKIYQEEEDPVVVTELRKG